LGACSLWISRDAYDSAAIEALADPDLLLAQPGAEIIKDQQKIKVARLRWDFGERSSRVYLKRYNAFSRRYRLLSLFRPSAARRAWRGASILMESGFRTGRPVAAVECRSWGMLTKSFYVSQEIPSAKTVDACWIEELSRDRGVEGRRRRRELLRSLAVLFRRLHQARIYHNDLKDANILVCPADHYTDQSFLLLDLEGIRRLSRVSLRRRIKNVVQLNRTLGRLVSRADKWRWARVYLGAEFQDRARRRSWLRRILGTTARADAHSMHKRKLNLTK
jgi:hypothetical protein